ncbi:hypothetical protein D3C83_255280 [compost metagenome]
MPVLEVVVAAPREMLDLELESTLASGEHLQRLKAGCDDFDADAIAGNGCDFVFAHVGCLESLIVKRKS